MIAADRLVARTLLYTGLLALLAAAACGSPQQQHQSADAATINTAQQPSQQHLQQQYQQEGEMQVARAGAGGVALRRLRHVQLGLRQLRQVEQQQQQQRQQQRQPSAVAPNATATAPPTGPLRLEPLPYDYSALEPVISTKIMQLHHDTHEATYVEKANTALRQLDNTTTSSSSSLASSSAPSLPIDATAAARQAANATSSFASLAAAPSVSVGGKAARVGSISRLAVQDVDENGEQNGSVEWQRLANSGGSGGRPWSNVSLSELLLQVGRGTLPPQSEVSIRNNGGGHWNHQLYWKVMSPPGSPNTSRDAISPQLLTAINTAFGSVDNMLAALKESADSRFGSGWAWVCEGRGGGLRVMSTANQDNPLMAVVQPDPCIPILGIDVWEHAYYLQYGPKRAQYTSAWMKIINWKTISANYDAAKRGDLGAIGADN